MTTLEKGMLIITFGVSKNEIQIIRSFIFCPYYITWAIKNFGSMYRRK
jgi:hypothetical protein